MQDAVLISVLDRAGTPICVAVEDGHKVHDAIAEKLSVGVPVIVSFAGVRRLTTAFLNAAIGQLYNEYDEAVIAKLVSATDIDPMTRSLLQRVIERAKQYFRDRTSEHGKLQS